ncbi:MAG: serine acetyltransferase [Verrucomicrobia bacterium]|nr:serine acetyltransferase [Verrucomicrobiota bacterium]
MISFILQDWTANANNPKGRFVLLYFRLCQRIRHLPLGLWVLGIPLLACYVLLVHWLMGIELDYKTTVGPRLSLQHGVGLVVHQGVLIGEGCTLRNGVTIGERPPREGVPSLGDRVDVGVNAVILGPITIGNAVVIGAGSVVIRDVEPGSVMAGSPARLIRRIHPSGM